MTSARYAVFAVTLLSAIATGACYSGDSASEYDDFDTDGTVSDARVPSAESGDAISWDRANDHSDQDDVGVTPDVSERDVDLPDTSSDARTDVIPDISNDAKVDAKPDTKPDSGSGDLGPCGTPWNRTVDAPYAIEATWMYGRANACELQKTLEKFHRAGGQWVWQFGPEFKRLTHSEALSDTTLKECMVSGKSCVQQALDEIGASRVSAFLTYSFYQNYSSKIIACPAFDKQITIGTKRYHRVLLPTSDSQGMCPSNGQVYVLFAITDGPDREELLLQTANALNIKVMLGMPSAPHDSTKLWDLDLETYPAMKRWAHRVFLDYKQRFTKYASFVGTYQSFEVHTRGKGGDNAYNMYGTLASLFHQILPDKLFAISPYWTSLKTSTSSTPADVTAGIKRLAQQGVDIIAPQDGRGTGKVGLYWPFEENKNISDIDPLLTGFEGASGTFAQKYNASTMQFYAAARQGIQQAGTNTKLWANLEAFEPVTTHACSYAPRGRTTLQRLNRAITMGAHHADHLISFMYDPYYTCAPASQPVALIDTIITDYHLPIVDTVFKYNSSGQDGFILRGYHIAESTASFDVTWYDSAWNVKSQTIKALWNNPTWGSTNNLRAYAQEVFIPFSFTNLAPNFWIHIRAKNSAGQAHERYSWQSS